VIVGPNAVGKSNIVDALRFIRDAVTSDLEHAVGKRGGMGRIRQYSRTRPYQVSIGLEFVQSFEDLADREASYELTIRSLTAGNYVIEHEKAACWVPAWESAGESASHDEAEIVWADAGFDRDSEGKVAEASHDGDRPVRSDQLALGSSAFNNRRGLPLEQFIERWQYSALYPNTLKVPTSPDKDTVLTEEGTNWASVLKALKRNARGRAALERIGESMRSVIPTFKDVMVTTVGSYLVPRFRFDIDKQVVEFDPVQLSDGTLRIFGILLALYQVPSPALLVIEEPEQTVHPGVLRVLADAIREASETTQIILTTHSPHLVDQFAPEEIRVASLTNGLTALAPIKATQVAAVKQRLMSLEEFMLAEGLQPEGS
jgi:predicted ATPase